MTPSRRRLVVHHRSVAADEPGSRAVIAAQAGAERSLLTAHAEAMDAKAGLLVGFAATITAFSVAQHAWLVRGALFASLFAAASGLVAMFRRRRSFQVIDLQGLVARVDRPPSETIAVLLGAQRTIVSRIERELAIKAALVRLSVGFLVVALILLLAANLTG